MKSFEKEPIEPILACEAVAADYEHLALESGHLETID